MSAFLFLCTVVFWGLTWYAIKVQITFVTPEVSIGYRFALATAMMFAYLLLTRQLHRTRLTDHLWFLALGLFLFGFNFVSIYLGSGYLASGVVAVLFTISTLFNSLNNWIFNRQRPDGRVLSGALMGMSGVALLFSQDLATLDLGSERLLGMGLVFLGTYIFSLGNMVSMQVSRRGIPLTTAMAWGMFYGTIVHFCSAGLQGMAFPTPTDAAFIWSLLYLALPGSVLGFLVYLSLLKRVGPERAPYATVCAPVVALTVSTFLEGYVWTMEARMGLPLILLGNLFIFARLPRILGRDGLIWR
jgi:drug/metabolite transporter (DMT)-like permease